MTDFSFEGFEYGNARCGVRNLVAIVAVMDNVNPIARAIHGQVSGTVLQATLFFRGQYGADRAVALRTRIGLASNPNIAAALIVSLESSSAEEVAAGVRASNIPVDVVVVQDVGGSVAAIAEGVRRAAKLVRQASQVRRSNLSVSQLTIGVECGGSDTTSGLSANPVIGYVADRVADAGGRVIISETSEFLGVEDIFAARAVTSQVRDEFLLRVTRFEAEAIGRGVDLLGTNPVPDNIAGGLTTIEEKALGAVAKAGTTALAGVLDYAESPGGPGLYFMDTPAPAVESMTALAAGGAHLILFGTGVSNTIGNPIAPTIKVTGNPRTAKLFADDIDFNVSAILEDGASIDEMGERLFEHVLDVASGTVTCSEILGQTELAISRFHPSI